MGFLNFSLADGTLQTCSRQSIITLFRLLCCVILFISKPTEAIKRSANTFSHPFDKRITAGAMVPEDKVPILTLQASAVATPSRNVPANKFVDSAWTMHVEPSKISNLPTLTTHTQASNRDALTPASFNTKDSSTTTTSSLAFQKPTGIPHSLPRNDGAKNLLLQPAFRSRCMYYASPETTSFQASNAPAITRLGSTVRKLLVGGNWKCHGTPQLSTQIVDLLNEARLELPDQELVDVVIAPPSLYAHAVQTHLKTAVKVATQDVSLQEGYGAFTGELSADMIKDSGLEWCIVGHSERRKGFGMKGETNDVVARKVKAAVNKNLNVILCVGEHLEERQAGRTMEVVAQQLFAVQKEISGEQWKNIVVAYEPVWAIGTGMTATPDMAQETHKEIREWIASHLGKEAAEKIRILYGGSVKGKNAKDLALQTDIDGFLVGGASISSDFIAILRATKEATPPGVILAA